MHSLADLTPDNVIKTQRRHGRKTVEVICQNCGKSFSVVETALRFGRGKNCSRECQYQSIAKSKRVPVTTVCQRCGKEIASTEYRLSRGRDKYCSRACQNPPVISRCATCGKEFRRSPSAHARYCSKECTDRDLEKSVRSRKVLLDRWSDEKESGRLRKAIERRSQTEDWKRKQIIGSRIRSDSAEWQEKNRMRQRSDTDIERLLADALTGMGIDFVAQYPFGRFTPDFAVVDAKLFIQADGTYWHGKPRTKAIDARFEEKAFRDGWRVLRFTDRDIKRDMDGVIQEIGRVVSCG